MFGDFGDFEKFVIEKMREAKVPALSVSVISEDETKYSRGFGFRDIASGLPATPRTIYGIGSVTKSFTALALMQLADEGKIDVQDEVEKYVPLKVRPFGESIRIHHLLTHSSGLPALGYAEALIRAMTGAEDNWFPISSPDDIITFMKDAESWAVSKPGERYFYLNEGWVMLGEIISRVSGLRYEEYIRKRVLEPLRMSRTYFSKAEVEREIDKATPYIVDKGGKHISSAFPYGISSDGGLLSNVKDMSNYVAMYLNRGQFDGKTLVSRKRLESMETSHIKLPYEFLEGESYGYGWRITPGFHGCKLISHAGSVGVYKAFAGYVPDKKIGVVLLANPSEYTLSHIGMYVLSQLMDVDPNTLPFIRNDVILSKLQGEYETYMGTMKINIKKRGDFLHFEMRDKYREQILPLVPERLGENQAMFFTLSEGGRYPVEFNCKKDTIELIYERYKLTKRK